MTKKKKNYFQATDIVVPVKRLVPDGNSHAMFMTMTGGDGVIEDGPLKGRKFSVHGTISGDLVFTLEGAEGAGAANFGENRFYLSATDFAQAVIDRLEKEKV